MVFGLLIYTDIQTPLHGHTFAYQNVFAIDKKCHPESSSLKQDLAMNMPVLIHYFPKVEATAKAAQNVNQWWNLRSERWYLGAETPRKTYCDAIRPHPNLNVLLWRHRELLSSRQGTNTATEVNVSSRGPQLPGWIFLLQLGFPPCSFLIVFLCEALQSVNCHVALLHISTTAKCQLSRGFAPHFNHCKVSIRPVERGPSNFGSLEPDPEPKNFQVVEPEPEILVPVPQT